MWPHSNPNSLHLIITCAVLLGTCMPSAAQTTAAIHLKNGSVLSGDVKVIGPASLSFTLAGASTSLSQNYTDIARIEWPEPDLWQEAMAAFDEGNPKAALALFAKLSTSPPAVNFHPAPGNFAERSRRMMLLCHRRLRDGAAIAKLVRQIDWAKLPEDERTVSPLLKVWSLIGASGWPAAKAAAEEAARTMGRDDPDMLELYFARARIAANLGLTDEAIAHYGFCYTLPSSDASLTADAIRESSALFIPLPERRDELRALAHLYATLVGRGKLWKDAPDEVTKLLGEKLREPVAVAATQGEMKAPANGSEPAPAPGAWITLTKFRFEPQPPGTPKPVPDPNKKPVKFEATGGIHKSTNAPAGWESAETRVAEFTSGNSSATLMRLLKEDPLMKLTKGKTLRLTMELRLGKLETKASKPVERVSFFRFGLLDAKKAGYGVHVSLMAKDRGISILGDTGGDDDLLGGPGVVKLPAEGGADKGISGGKVLPCEITLQLQDEGKVLVTASIDNITGTATFDAAAGQPVVTDFNSGFFVIRIGKPKTSVLFDNVAIEVSP